MQETVVKIQTPLAGNAEPAYLVYNKDRSVEFTISLQASRSINEAMSGSPKRFFEASINSKGVIHIHTEREVEDPGW